LKSFGIWSLKKRSKKSLKGSFGPKGMGIWPLPLTTFTVLMFTTEFSLSCKLCKRHRNPGGEPGLCAAEFEVRPARVDIPKTVTKQIAIHPIKVVLLDIPSFSTSQTPSLLECPLRDQPCAEAAAHRVRLSPMLIMVICSIYFKLPACFSGRLFWGLMKRVASLARPSFVAFPAALGK